MNWGLLTIIILLCATACEPQYTIQELYFDTDADPVDTDTVSDPDCLTADICTQVTDPKCRAVGGMVALRWLTGSCHCDDGKQVVHYAEQRCLEGCIQNSNGQDWCVEDSPPVEEAPE